MPDQIKNAEYMAQLLAASEDTQTLAKMLGAALEEDDIGERAALLLALALKKEPLATLELIKYDGREENPDVLAVFLKVLGISARNHPYLVREISNRLLRYLRHEEPLVRHGAIVGLTSLLKSGRTGDLQAILGLSTAANTDEHPINRSAAAEGLMDWGIPHLENIARAPRHVLDSVILLALDPILEDCAERGEAEVKVACTGALQALRGA